MSLLVVGTLAFDSVETPFGKTDESLGGSASYLATAASYFTDVRMVGVVGDDFPEEHLDFYRSRKITTDGVVRLPGETFRWSGRYPPELNACETIYTHLNVLEQFDPKLPEGYRDSKYVVLGNIAPELQLQVLEQVDEPALVAADTMNFWIDSSRDALIKTLSRVDIISVNDGEARMLSKEYHLVRAAAVIREMGPKVVIIKRGEHGATVYTDDGIFSSPAFPLEQLSDPTGAGDSFAGGMMGYLTRQGALTTKTLRQAIIMGSVLASYAVQDFSLDRFRTLELGEIKERFEGFKRLTSFETDSTDLW